MAYKGKLIASGSNAKTIKGDGDAYETAIMYMAPFTSAGVGNVCPMALIAKCVEGCLNTAGRAAMFASIPEARKRKTEFYMKDRAGFMATLVNDIRGFVRYCEKRGVKAAVRLNGTSDIQWERGHPVTVDGVRYDSLMAAFPMVQFYDYTKIYKRVDRELPVNYALTLSYSAANSDYAREITERVASGKANAAVVYRNKAVVKQMMETLPNVIDGDLTDMRFLDPQGGYIVALYAKGKAKADQSGFVIG